MMGIYFWSTFTGAIVACFIVNRLCGRLGYSRRSEYSIYMIALAVLATIIMAL